MSLNLVFSVAFSALFTWLGWMPHGGLALANSLATFLEMAGLLVFMRRRLDGLEGRHILSGLAQASAATLVMSFGLWFWLQATSSLPVWVTVIGGIGLGAFLYGLVVLALGVGEAKTLWGMMLRRVHSLSGRG
jgi:putative peptidoglycan lipid II flippase